MRERRQTWRVTRTSERKAIALRGERNELATEMNDASNSYGGPVPDPTPVLYWARVFGYALGHGRGTPHLPCAARRMRVFLDAPVG
jgi:hypothetical protein